MNTTDSQIDPIPRRALLGVALGAAGVGVLAGRSAAGPLNPPAGPVTSTGKTLTEIEPRTPINAANTPGDAGALFVIPQPGSYYLPGHATVPSGKVGIRIDVGHVTIDLGGFRLTGNSVAGTSGISDGGGEYANITVRNGIIENMGGIGVFLLSFACRLTDLLVRGCSNIGILTANRVRLERVTARGNAAAASNPAGIFVSSECVLEDCAALENTGVGIWVGANVLLRGCTARQNTKEGFRGGATCLATRCVASANGAAGIFLELGAVIESCASISNAGPGFSASFGSVVRHCFATLNVGGGFVTWEGAVLAACTASNNALDGFNITTGTAMRECVGTFSNSHGINANTAVGSSIHGCVARNNGNSGIIASARCVIRENNCSSNCTVGPNAAGIQVSSTSNLVADNLCASNSGYGCWVTGSRNMVVRNGSSQNNVNWNMAGGNIYGPVIDRTVPASGAVLGNGTVGSVLGTLDPFTNLSF